MAEVFYSNELIGLTVDEAKQFIVDNIVYYEAPHNKERITQIYFAYGSLWSDCRYEYGRLTVWMGEDNKIVKIRGMG
jgi:hypothetical protein